MDTGEKIKRRRLDLGLTLEEVGDFVGVTKSTVRKWETGASMLLDKGLDLENLSRMLGHSNSKITSEIYTHVVSDGIKKAANIYKQIVPKSSRSQKS